MNLTSNNIMLLTNSQSPQENRDNNNHHELNNQFQKMSPFTVNHLKILFNNHNLKLSSLKITHYQFLTEDSHNSQEYNNQSTEPQSNKEWSQYNNLFVTNNLEYNNKSVDNQSLDKVKECQSRELLTELQYNLIIHKM